MNNQEDNEKKDINLSFFIKVLAVYIGISVFILCVMIILLRTVNVVDLSPDALTSLPEALSIYDSSDNLVTTKSGEQNRIFIDINQLQQHTVMAFVAAEDARFFSHNGIDIKRIFGALLSDIKAGYFKEGGSTISQQLIKNSHLSATKKISRKIQEVILALQLESRYSKEDILEMYLNYIYFGYGSYGIQVAANTYFNKNASELTISESAALAGLIKSPTNYSPYTNIDAFITRRNRVLDQMLEQQIITKEQHETAINEELNINKNNNGSESYGYFIDHILNEAASLTQKSIDEYLNGGYHIYTTLNTEISDYANQVINDSEVFPSNDVECAVVIMDSKNGSVYSLIGGRKYTSRLGFNRATMAKRSPGSTIKPLLVYAPALQSESITAATVLLDEKKSFGSYSPDNFNDKYYGNVTVRDSLIKSLNIPSVELLDKIGIDNCKSYLMKMGYEFDKADIGLPLALGGLTNGITPLELSSYYQTLANSGIQSTPNFIRKITDNNGNEVYNQSKQSTKDKRIYSTETTYIINDILREAAQKYASPFRQVNSSICAKTGTASYKDIGNSDIWVCAYDSNYTIVVWMGHDKTDSQHHIPQSVTGSKYPSVIAASILKKIYSKQSPADTYAPPDNVISIPLDGDALKNGEVYLATELTPAKVIKTEYFIKGTEPKDYSEYYSVPNECDINVDASTGIPIISITPNNNFTFYHLYRISQGEHKLLTTMAGEKDHPLSYCDTDAYGTVKYYVIPEHRYITSLDGSALLGKASRLVEATAAGTTQSPSILPSETGSTTFPNNTFNNNEPELPNTTAPQ